jgi:competence protein ComEC
MTATDAGPSRRAAGGPVAARPAVAAAALFAMGIAAHAVVPRVPAAWLAGVVLALVFAWRWLDHPARASGALACGLAFAGIAAGQLGAFFYPRHHISAFAGDDPRLAQLELHLGHAPRVLTSPFAQHHPLPPRQVATASVSRVKTRAGWAPACGEVLVQINQPHPRLQENQTVRVLGMLQRPAPAMNPGQFDWAHYYREQRVLASLHIPHAENIEILDSPGPTPVMWLRDQTRRLLAAGFAPGRSLDHALLRALLLGDHDPQLRDVQEHFQRTGTSHHLAISGMHVAVLGGLVYWVCRLLCLSPRLAVCLMTGFVILYGVAALPSPPVVRSVLLCVAFGIGVAGGRSVDAAQLLALSVLAMLVYHPLDLYNAGFQLSFGTVLGLILFTEPVLKALRRDDPDLVVARALGPKPGRLRLAWEWFNRELTVALAAGLVAWFVSMPLIAWHFEQLNPWAVIAGIILAPIVFAALVAGLFKVVLTLLWPGAASVWASAAAAPVVLMRHTVDRLAKLPWGDVPVPVPRWWLVVAFYALLLLMLWPCRHAGLRWCFRIGRVAACGAMVFLPFHAGGFALPGVGGAGQTRVTLLAVGAGQCAVVQPPSGRVVLIDAGSTSLSDLVPKCLGPFLRHERCTSVDSIFLSHSNYDHFGAAAEVAEAYGVREVLTADSFVRESAGNASAEALLESLGRLHRPPRLLAPGERIPLGRDTAIEILWPPADPDRALGANDSSLVVRLTHAGRSILFTGDIEAAAMRELMKDPQRLKSDVLVAPHHGSSETTSAGFLEAVHPSTVLSSNDRSLSGKQRRFDRVAEARAVPLLRTNRCGAITVTFNADGTFEAVPFLPARK